MEQVAVNMATIEDVETLINANDNNITALNTLFAPAWLSSPSVRGTSDILWSCISTLVACIYTALHLNVPANTGTWAMLKHKAEWLLVALLALEIVVYMAISQLYAAYRLKTRLRELFQDDTMDLTYCFVVIGGVEVRNLHPHMRRAHPYLPVSPDTMLWLAELRHKVPVEAKRIRDKSKADTVQKCLVLFQTTWMALQCIARRAIGLQITILEVHTMVHVLCAAVMYAFWLKVNHASRSSSIVDTARVLTMCDCRSHWTCESQNESILRNGKPLLHCSLRERFLRRRGISS